MQTLTSQNKKNALDQALGKARGAFITVGLFSIIINLLMLVAPLYMMQIFDRVLSGQSRQTLLYLTIIAVMAVGVLGALDLIRSRILVRVGTWVEQSLSAPVYLKGLDNALIGRSYRTEALRDLGTLKGFLSGNGILSLFDAPWVPVYLAIVYLPAPHDPAVLEPLAEAIRDSGLPA